MVLRLERIHKSYTSGFRMRRKPVLCGIDLELQAGDAYALLGSNGAGKSTTLRVLLGLSVPDRGGGTLLGKPLGDREAHRRIGYLPESPSFHEQLEAAEFLTLSGQLLGLRGRALAARIDMLLERVELSEARARKLRKLSKGMLQRLGLAQALLGDPDLLVLDEPMSGLDPPGRKLVRDLILEQRAAGKTVLFSTHILSDAEVVCTRAGILAGGRIARDLHLDELHRIGAEAVEITVAHLVDEHVQRLEPQALASVRSGSQVLFTLRPGAPAQEFMRAVLQFNGRIESVVPRRVSLEKVYIETAGPAHEPRADAPAPPALAPAGRR